MFHSIDIIKKTVVHTLNVIKFNAKQITKIHGQESSPVAEETTKKKATENKI